MQRINSGGRDESSADAEPLPPPRRKRTIFKTVLAAISLFAVGSVMLWLGAQALLVDRDRGIAMLVVGSLAFIPGSYASWTLLGAWCRWRDYRYSDLPSYDEE